MLTLSLQIVVSPTLEPGAVKGTLLGNLTAEHPLNTKLPKDEIEAECTILCEHHQQMCLQNFDITEKSVLEHIHFCK